MVVCQHRARHSRGGGRHLQGLSQLSCDGTVRGALLRGVFGQDGVSTEDSFCTGIDQIQALLLLLGTSWAPVYGEVFDICD